MDRDSLHWQSKLVLLLVLPVVGCGVFFDTVNALRTPSVIVWVLALSTSLGILTLGLKAATPFAAVTGFLITAQLVYATADRNHFQPWRTFLIPVLAVALLAHIATRIGRAKKEELGAGEAKHGRSAAQVAANLGAAALLSTTMVQVWAWNSKWLAPGGHFLLIASLAAMAEAAADTVSSEIGQVFGGQPRMITTFRITEPGTDGGITIIGSIAGIAAAAVVASSVFLMGGQWFAFNVVFTGAVVGLFFDSLLGATFERRGWLNNDAVNFLSTICAGMVAAWLAERFVHFPSL